MGEIDFGSDVLVFWNGPFKFNCCVIYHLVIKVMTSNLLIDSANRCPVIQNDSSGSMLVLTRDPT